MAEELNIDTQATRAVQYQDLLTQLKGLTTGETDTTANLANVAAALRQTFGFFWVGFYLVKDEELVLGPFQGDVACTRIAKGRGVCGVAWQDVKTQVVPDVDAFPGHIACSSASRSEVVVPLVKDNVVIGVLDVDSDLLNDFSYEDVKGLECIAQWLVDIL